MAITPPAENLVGTYEVVSQSRSDTGEMQPSVHVLEIGVTQIKADKALDITETGGRMYDNQPRPYELFSFIECDYLRWEANPSYRGGFCYEGDGLMLVTWKRSNDVIWTIVWEKESDGATIP